MTAELDAGFVCSLSANCNNRRSNKPPVASNYIYAPAEGQLIYATEAASGTAAPHGPPSAVVINVAIKTFTLPASRTKHVIGCHGYRSLSLKLFGNKTPLQGRCTHLTSSIAGPAATGVTYCTEQASQSFMKTEYYFAVLTLTRDGCKQFIVYRLLTRLPSLVWCLRDAVPRN